MEQNKTWYGAMALMRAMLLIVNENCCFNPCTLLNRQNVMELLSRGERILFFGPNTNTNNIRNQNFDRIRIRIIFVFSE